MDIVFEVQSFVRTKRGGLRPDIPLEFANAGCAAKAASRLSKTKDVVIAVAHDDGERAALLVAYGDVPEAVTDLPEWISRR